MGVGSIILLLLEVNMDYFSKISFLFNGMDNLQYIGVRSLKFKAVGLQLVITQYSAVGRIEIHHLSVVFFRLSVDALE